MYFKIKILIFLLSVYSFSQNKVIIKQSDFLQNYSENNINFDMFCGNVIAQYKNHKLYCDTIFISKDGRYVRAGSKKYCKIRDDDGAKIQSKKIEFFKNDTIINFIDQVLFKKKENKIKTNYLIYNPEKKIIYYENGGEISDKENTITSLNGIYHINDEFGQFSENVNIKTNNYEISSNNIDLDNKNNIIFLNSRSTIKSDSLTIQGDQGFINKSNESIDLWNNTYIKSKEREVFSDSLSINEKKETKLSGNTEIHQKDNLKIYCQNYIEKNSLSKFNGKPFIILSSEKNDLKIEGESMKMFHNDSILYISNNTYIFSDSIQGKCDNSTFDFKSELVTMLNNPVLWTKKDQIIGDTIYIYTKSETLDSIYIPTNSFIISKKNNDLFNQIKGNKLEGKFKKGNLHKLKLFGNTELKYFEFEENNESSGLNDIICSNIIINFKENEINNISFINNPQATYTPKNLFTKKSMLLEGFINRFNEKKY
tara:strand:+ start:678 stop:2126 length:1449 start_codon:yes stop_codon:yes gene_type:complete